jgi:hypothetical protein
VNLIVLDLLPVYHGQCPSASPSRLKNRPGDMLACEHMSIQAAKQINRHLRETRRDGAIAAETAPPTPIRPLHGPDWIPLPPTCLWKRPPNIEIRFAGFRFGGDFLFSIA